MTSEAEKNDLEERLELLNKCYTDLSQRRDSLMAALAPWLGDVRAIQPELVAGINALTEQMMNLVDRSDQLLQKLQGSGGTNEHQN